MLGINKAGEVRARVVGMVFELLRSMRYQPAE